MLTSALPFMLMAMAPAAYAQTAINTASVEAPSGVVDPDTANNSAIDTDTILADIQTSNDSVSDVNGLDGATAVLNVLDGDTLNGSAIDPADVVITEAVADPTGALTLNSDGTVDVAVGTPAGTYVLTYQICETANPTNCETATATVEVVAPPIAAAPETFGPINGTDGGVTGSVLTSDTLNGVAVDPADITLTVDSSDPELTLDPATGLITVAPGTPAGTYEVTYTICEDLNPTNCATVTEQVVVEESPIAAVNNSASGISSVEGAENILNVLDNDTLNGEVIDPADVVVSLPPGTTLPEGFTLNPDGSVDIAPGTPEGVYSFDYQICEVLNPTNCSIATVTVTIDPPVASVSGVVYLDNNSNQNPDSGEPLFEGWIVNIYDERGNLVAQLVTDANGYYETDLPLGNYTVEFVNPENGAVFASNEIVLDANSKPNGVDIEAVVNLPIDPSGVVYDSVTRQPIEGAIVTLVDANGNLLPEVCFIDPSQQTQTTDSMGIYRFDLVPGADPACPVGQTNYTIVIDAPASHNDPISSVIAPETGFFMAPAGSGPFRVGPQATAPQFGDSTTYYLGFALGSGSRDVIFNHIPLDPITLIRSELTVLKVTSRRDVKVGDLVPYEIEVTNTEDLPRVDLDIIDYLPAGLRYVDDTARLNGEAITPDVDGREVRVEDLDFAANETKTLSLMVVVGAGVTEGNYTNQAYVEDGTGSEVSNRGEATVRLVADPLFDCSEVIGKVFDDINGNGVQDAGELGLPGVRLATVKGLLVTTDATGKYHIPCAAVPNAKIGSNFVLKINEDTLPTGYTMTTENPRVVRLTRGKMSKMNFGVALTRAASIDLEDAAFVTGQTGLKSEYASQLDGLVANMADKEPILHLIYKTETGSDLAKARLDKLAGDIRSRWNGSQDDLIIEKKLIKLTQLAGGE